MNLVDESDLMALMEDKNAAVTPMPSPGASPIPSASPGVTPMPEVTPDNKNNTSGLVLLIVLVAALGVGAFFLFRARKSKRNVSGNTNISELDDFEFDDDETDKLISEPKPEETDLEKRKETEDDL